MNEARDQTNFSQQGTNSIIGASVPRIEDKRHLSGHASFVADLRLPGMREAVFVRSNIAHGKILRIVPPDDVEPDQFWTAKSLGNKVRPIIARLNQPRFREAEYPILASAKVRFVGEAIAVVIAENRARAEDLAERVTVELEPLPVVPGAEAALAGDAARLHEQWPDNRFIEVSRSVGDLDAAIREADVTVTRKYRMARLSPCPLEPRGCLAVYDERLDQLTCYMTTQRPHVMRTFLSEQLVGIDERQIRVVTSDVGGAFGGKATLYPEDVALAAIAMQLKCPVRWIEDRLEAFIAATQAREQLHRVTAYAKKSGDILAVDAEILVDGGAYSMRPPTAASEGNMAANVLPGPYRLKNYRFVTTTVCTNKPPVGPFRGVGRPAACFAIERTLDEVAHAIGLDPSEVRLRNMIKPDEFPYTTVTGLIYDSGDYPEMLRKAMAAIGHREFRAEQTRASPAMRTRLGLGYAIYVEQTAHGAEEWFKRGSSIDNGFESARVRLHPSGTLTVDVGIQSHGQGLETTLAQIASHVTTIPYDRISVRQGDTEVSPYGLGTIASRSIVMAGGATYHGCVSLSQKIRAIGAALQECSVSDVQLHGGCVVGPKGAIPFSEIANAAYLNIQRLPHDLEPGLEILYQYRPPVETGAFSAGLHAAKVSVDLDTGHVRIVDYVIVEDCGQVINPMIVDGQVMGGMAQGVGQALYEEIRHSEIGEPMNVTFADYLLPGPVEVPNARIEHQATLSPFTVFGVKGTGEGGGIAPPAAVANAITDALKEFRISVDCTPITPAGLWLAFEDARATKSGVVVHTKEIAR